MSEHHSELSPSSLPALAKCPCFKTGLASEAADKGTEQHRLLTAALTGVPEELTVAVPEIVWARDQIIELCEGREMNVECHLSYTDDDFNEVTFGTGDVVCCFDDYVLIIDYKSGEIRDYRAQLLCYAVAAMSATGMKRAHCVELYGRYERMIAYEVTYDIAKSETDAIITAIKNPDKTPCACEYCGWCSKVETCTETTERVAHVASANGWQLIAFDGYLSNTTEAGKALKLAKAVKQWAESVEESVRDYMLKGNPVVGYQISQRAGNRMVSDVKGAFTKSGLTSDEFIACCKVSVTELEKQYGEHHGLKGKTLKTNFATAMTDSITNGKPVTTIAETK